MFPKDKRQYRAAVARGAKLLDKARPGWWRKVRVTRLEITDPFNCVLKHVYGSYNDGTEALLLVDECVDVTAHGFDADYHFNEYVNERWREEVRVRRRASTV